MLSVGDRVVVRVRDRSSPYISEYMKYDGVTGEVRRVEGSGKTVKPDPECVTRERPCFVECWLFSEHLFDVQPLHNPADVLPDRDWS